MNVGAESTTTYQQLPILLSLVVGASLIGFFVGVTPPEEPTVAETGPSHITLDAKAVPAMTYGEQPRFEMSLNKEWRTVLRTDARSMHSGLPIPTLEEKRVELARRRLNRAYDGAPPTIPHAVDAMSTDECLVCHESGLQLESVSAPAMPHEKLINCTQCHVESGNLEGSLFADSGFKGRKSKASGERIGIGAPPVIPHSTWMREDCMSCHGDSLTALRTSHPERKNCRQCHAVPATVDQLPLDESAFVPPLEITR